MPVSILMKLCDGEVVHMASGVPGHLWDHPAAQCHGLSGAEAGNGEGMPGSCITEIFLLSFAATEWELFLLTHQQRGRRWGKAVRDCHIELLARNACIKLQAGQKFLSPHLFSHQTGICVMSTQKSVTRDCCNHDWVVPAVCILSLTVCITPPP